VIVRISGEGQYRLEESHHERLNELDDAVVAAGDGGDAAADAERVGARLDYVRSEGAELADDDLEGSDFILPPPDLTFEEAGTEFNGDGLIPDPA
jgi:hypothetical protein